MLEYQANGLVREMSKVFEYLKGEMFRAQRIQEKKANRHRASATRFKVGGQVWLNAKFLNTKSPSKKLDWKQLGPYKVK